MCKVGVLKHILHHIKLLSPKISHFSYIFLIFSYNCNFIFFCNLDFRSNENSTPKPIGIPEKSRNSPPPALPSSSFKSMNQQKILGMSGPSPPPNLDIRNIRN